MKKSRLFFIALLSGLVFSSCEKDAADESGSKLPVPQNVAADAVSQTSVRLTWTTSDPASVASYTVAYAEADVRNFYEKECFETETLISGLESQTEYVFRVRANSSGAVENNSDWSVEVTLSTLAPVVPDMPLNMRVVTDEVSSTRIGLAWDASSGASKYFVSYKMEDDDEFTEIETDLTEIVIDKLDVETQYIVKVRAWSEVGFSDFTPELSVSTLSRSEGIFNAEDLVAFAAGVADGGEWQNESGQVVIRRDIDMSGVEWIPMPEFTGVLDGTGKTITNLVCQNDGVHVGLIGVLKGTVSNLTLGEGCSFESVRNTVAQNVDEIIKTGAFAAVIEGGGKLQNCTSGATVKAGLGCVYIGGLIGLSHSEDDSTIEISSCTYTGSLTLSGGNWVRDTYPSLNIGGIVGSAETGTTVTGCHNQGTIQSNNTASAASNRMEIYTGGIAGHGIEATFVSCTNDEAGQIIILTNPHYSRVGGIVGYTQGVSMTDCDNYGSLSLVASNDAGSEYEAGGIIGRNLDGAKLLLTGCRNHADMTAEAPNEAGKPISIAGVIGYIRFNGDSFEVSDCHNEGDLNVAASKSTSRFGGIVGAIEGAAQGVVENCTNQGNLTANMTTNSALHTGGIVGANMSGTSTVRNCSNSGNIDILSTRKAYGGGIIGEAQNGSTIENCTNSGYVRALYNAGDVCHIGGIASRTYRGATIRGCVNEGDIIYGGGNPEIGADKAGGFGGIVGYLDKSPAIVDGCTNTGTILGDAGGLGKKGAICGWASPDGPTTIQNCTVQGRIGNYDASAEDLGVAAAQAITAENYENYIYGAKISEVTVSGNVYSK